MLIAQIDRLTPATQRLTRTEKSGDEEENNVEDADDSKETEEDAEKESKDATEKPFKRDCGEEARLNALINNFNDIDDRREWFR